MCIIKVVVKLNNTCTLKKLIGLYIPGKYCSSAVPMNESLLILINFEQFWIHPDSILFYDLGGLNPTLLYWASKSKYYHEFNFLSEFNIYIYTSPNILCLYNTNLCFVMVAEVKSIIKLYTLALKLTKKPQCWKVSSVSQLETFLDSWWKIL